MKLIKNGTIINEGRSFVGDLLLDGEFIKEIYEGEAPRGNYDEVIDASGCFVLPGVIDDHVHFREPGLTQKADIESESRAAAFGGVTSYFEMPNTVPQTTTLEAWQAKRQLGAEKSHVNYSFFFGATNDNVNDFEQLDTHHVPGIKLFMGSSTGNMLVDKYEALQAIFKKAKELDLPVMTHCEDIEIINRNMQLAKESGAHLHIAHVTTAKELEFFGKDENITGEAVVAHLMFSDKDYAVKGARIKCNPAIKTAADREALRKALSNGKITVVGTDHAPHQLKDKQGGCAKAASGMPMVQFSLVSMLKLVDEKVISIERLVELMCHNPARLFHISQRGFLRPGYKADVVVVRKGEPWKVTEEVIQSKCKWSPVEGDEFAWKVEQTFCNGRLIYDKGVFDAASRGEELEFRSNS